MVLLLWSARLLSLAICDTCKHARRRSVSSGGIHTTRMELISIDLGIVVNHSPPCLWHACRCSERQCRSYILLGFDCVNCFVKFCSFYHNGEAVAPDFLAGTHGL